jgi:hypothetical protein
MDVEHVLVWNNEIWQMGQETLEEKFKEITGWAVDFKPIYLM